MIIKLPRPGTPKFIYVKIRLFDYPPQVIEDSGPNGLVDLPWLQQSVEYAGSMLFQRLTLIHLTEEIRIRRGKMDRATGVMPHGRFIKNLTDIRDASWLLLPFYFCLLLFHSQCGGI